MMPSDRFERQLPELLTELAESRAPEYLEDLLWQTAHTSQRPAWTLLERWIPMDVTLSRVHAPAGARYVALLAILTLLAAVAFAIAGSQRHIPTPFGPAANGLIAFTTATGDIAAGDPVTGVTRTIVDGPERDSSPTFSLDGTRIAFVRKVEEMVRVFVVDAAGGKPIELTRAPLPTAAWLRWSPDGARLAWLSEGSLWIAITDGSDAHRVDLDMTIREEIAWRPPDGSELLVRGLPNGKAAFGLFLVKPDGSELRPVTPLDGGTPNYRSLTWSPDGRRFAYGDKPSPGEYSQQVHVLTIAGLRDVVLKPDDDSGLLFPAWSPDSNLILAVPWGTGEPWLMDPAGGPGRRVSWTASDFPRNRGSWSNWQRLAPTDPAG